MTVRLLARRAGSSTSGRVGEATAGPDGTWSLTTRPLPPGRYRVTALASVLTNSSGKRLHARPTAWAEPLAIDPGRSPR